MRAERENGIAGHFLDHVADQHACPSTRFIKPECSYRLFHRTSCMHLSTHAWPIVTATTVSTPFSCRVLNPTGILKPREPCWVRTS